MALWAVPGAGSGRAWAGRAAGAVHKTGLQGRARR